MAPGRLTVDTLCSYRPKKQPALYAPISVPTFKRMFHFCTVLSPYLRRGFPYRAVVAVYCAPLFLRGSHSQAAHPREMQRRRNTPLRTASN